MGKIVECVPNFSEGRDKNIINTITREIEGVNEVELLDVDPGADTNRTVVTLIGTPEGVKEAAFNAIKKASELIDMANHRGAHARMGATDVCPFVPVSGVTMEECVELAREVAERVAGELEIPVYLYEEAASSPERRNLAYVRKGEYEGLPEKLKDPNMQPDYGKPVFNKKSGATAIGAREFLIAYNINLNTRDRLIAREIAFGVREKGRVKRDGDGKIVRDENRKIIRVPGKCKAVKGVGWYIEEYGIAQISMNLTNYNISNMHHVFDGCCEEAIKYGVRITGSELVGLVPREAMLMAGRHYLQKQGKSIGVPEKELIHVAVKSMGMHDITPFIAEEKIIEYRVEKTGKLASMSVKDFIEEVSVDSPAPGGGSVAAMSGSLAAALTSMVCNLTVGKKGYEDVYDMLDATAVSSQQLLKDLLIATDKDTEAFNEVLNAMRLPKKTEEEKAKREEAVQAGYQVASRVPLRTAERCLETIDLAARAVTHGNVNSVSDAGVAALMGYAGLIGAILNVKINLPSITDQAFNAEMRKNLDTMSEDGREKLDTILQEVLKKIEEG